MVKTSQETVHSLVKRLAPPGLLLLLCITTIYLSGRSPVSGPRRPLKIVVPFLAGGESDTFARLIKKAIEDNDLLDEPIVILNLGGAGGTIGSRHVKNAPPDGYTVLLLHDALLTARYFRKVSYGPEAFEPVAGTMENGLVLVTADPAYKSLPQLLGQAQKHPNTIVFGANLGAPTHLVGLQLQEAPAYHGAKFRYVQAGGGARRFSALKGGEITVTAFSVPEYLRFRTPEFHVLAVLDEQRHPELPDVPTAREQGVDLVVSNMQMWWVPRGTSQERIHQLAQVFATAMRTPEVQRKLKEMHSEPTVLTGNTFVERIEKRQAEISQLPPPSPPALPDYPSLIFIALGLTGVWLGGKWLVANRGARGWAGLISLGGLVGYVLILDQRWLPFPLATAGFVLLASASFRTPRLASLPTLVLLALTVGFGLDALFTRFFFVDLP